MMRLILLRSSNSDERGIASILSVVFFILISSIVTVGFMRMALLEGRQTLEDSLSKAALAAAYSGVNDAKRALLYCAQFGSIRPAECANLNDTTCPGFYANTVLRDDKLGLVHDSATGSIQVGDVSLNERYTCVLVSEDTPTVEGSLIEGSADRSGTVIPLKGVSTFDRVVISWHSVNPFAPSLNGLSYGSDPYNANYRHPEAIGSAFKASADWPAVLSANLMAQNGDVTFDPSNGNANGLSQRRWLFYPHGTIGVTNIPVNTDPVSPSRQLVRCSESGYKPAQTRGLYVCSMTITNLGDLPGEKYLQLTSLNSDTNYAVELRQGAASVLFDNVNPKIDSTGAVENVFRRIQVGVSFNGDGYGGRDPILPNAIDTGAGLCKNFSVGLLNSEFTEGCGY